MVMSPYNIKNGGAASSVPGMKTASSKDMSNRSNRVLTLTASKVQKNANLLNQAPGK